MLPFFGCCQDHEEGRTPATLSIGSTPDSASPCQGGLELTMQGRCIHGYRSNPIQTPTPVGIQPVVGESMSLERLADIISCSTLKILSCLMGFDLILV